MTNIIEVQKNILNIDCDIIAHGCNCFHTMSAGVALALRSKHPEVFQADLQTKYGDMNKLGTFSKADIAGKKIYNLYTQYRYGREKRHLNYEALYSSLTLMNKDIETHYKKDVTISLPKIGCDLAGGDWDIVKVMLSKAVNQKYKIIIALGSKNQ